MRHIHLHRSSPDPEWSAKADALIEELKAAPNLEARYKIIDDNSALWRDLKEWLLSLSHQKCWFSEAKDCFNHWDVEHYRPKKRALDDDSTAYEGYWWLAFDWTNYRICGTAGNRKKGSFFPLRNGCNRVDCDGDVRHEVPMLLDPVDEDDPVLLFFNIEGRAIAAPHVTSDWEKQRVEYSVKRCNLDFPPLWKSAKLSGPSAGIEYRSIRGSFACVRRTPRMPWPATE